MVTMALLGHLNWIVVGRVHLQYQPNQLHGSTVELYRLLTHWDMSSPGFPWGQHMRRISWRDWRTCKWRRWGLGCDEYFASHVTVRTSLDGYVPVQTGHEFI
jgi:hypothetical protein